MATVSSIPERMLTTQLSLLVKPSLAFRPSHSVTTIPKEYAMQCMMIVLLSRQCICLSRVLRNSHQRTIPLGHCLFNLFTWVLFSKIDRKIVYSQKHRSSCSDCRSSRYPTRKQSCESLIPEDLG